MNLTLKRSMRSAWWSRTSWERPEIRRCSLEESPPRGLTSMKAVYFHKSFHLFDRTPVLAASSSGSLSSMLQSNSCDNLLMKSQEYSLGIVSVSAICRKLHLRMKVRNCMKLNFSSCESYVEKINGNQEQAIKIEQYSVKFSFFPFL